MLSVDSVPPELWGLFAGIVAALGAVIAILGRQLEKTTGSLESLQAKMIDQAVPALERSTLAGQAMGPVLQQNAEAMGSMARSSENVVRAADELMRWVAVLEDRQRRSPGGRSSS